MPEVVWLADRPAETVAGGKMARLAQLLGVVRVPRSFVVAAGARGSPTVDRAIAAAYAELGGRVAVRSSAVGEDASGASFAGIFESYLGVSGAAEVVAAVHRCWDTVALPRVVAYLREHGMAELPMAVGVCELVEAVASGVAFSVHPLTGSPDRVVIEANWGLGETVAQGTVSPDRIEVDKADGRVLVHTVTDKTVVSQLSPSGRVVQVPAPPELRCRPVLDAAGIAAVLDVVRAVERHDGHPVDLEWVIDDAGVVVVQARPITVAVAPAVWDPVALFLESMP
ncbi:MAG: PEP/pyruvate-binding domain-containing protein [Jatrophihabitans sp.]|uniref:PEP/pyruvate-binding domain-containing protein n=1 Tax=Jatrophihabitans sp. TaxID=1932789 RepID=UPI003F7F01C2